MKNVLPVSVLKLYVRLTTVMTEEGMCVCYYWVLGYYLCMLHIQTSTTMLVCKCKCRLIRNWVSILKRCGCMFSEQWGVKLWQLSKIFPPISLPLTFPSYHFFPYSLLSNFQLSHCVCVYVQLSYKAFGSLCVCCPACLTINASAAERKALGCGELLCL